MGVNWKQMKDQADIYGQRMHEAVSGVVAQNRRQQTMEYTGEMQPRNVREARDAAVDRAAARIAATTRIEHELTTAGRHLDYLLREDLQEHEIDMLRREIDEKRRMAEAKLDAQGWANLGRAVGMGAALLTLL